MAFFAGTGRRIDKNEYNLFCGKGGTEYYFEVFSSKYPYRLNESRKTGFGGTFSLISVVLLGRLFPKPIEFIHEWIRTNHVNFMKIESKLRPVLCVLTH